MEAQSIQSIRSTQSVRSLASTNGTADESLIFERSVEDPFGPVKDAKGCSLCSVSQAGSVVNFGGCGAGGASQGAGACRHKSHNLEDLIAPALDASADIVEDAGTSLDNVDMIYSKRPSTIGLDMALGRTRASSFAEYSNDNESIASGGGAASSGLPERPRILPFYSYAEMLSDEGNQPNRRPSITHSLSSSLLRHPPPQNTQEGTKACAVQLQPPSFSSPLVLPSGSVRRESATQGGVSPRSLRCAMNLSSRIQKSPSSGIHDLARPSLELSSSDWSSSDEDNTDRENVRGASQDSSRSVLSASPGSPTYVTPTASGTSYSVRGSQSPVSSSHAKKLPTPVRHKNQYISCSPLPHGGVRRGPQQFHIPNMEDVFNTQLQVESVGEVLRKRAGSTSSTIGTPVSSTAPSVPHLAFAARMDHP
ncbi:AaceriAER431Cp [[Ashbya] aceris (nom. inval.)]|nr:AaceriAER431Cp [[Ashbya] aceris (nom. inval.)]